MNYEQNNGLENNYNNDFNNGYNNYQYTNPVNNNNNKQPLSYYIKRFLVGFLLIAILIFLLLWLLPTKQDMQDAITDSLNPLYDRIFSENIETMKEVAIAYYTTERLPKKEGDTKKLTLGEMLEMKLLLEIKDKNGEMCDVNDSYVEITKMKDEYKMKVNLSCDDEEDYIIVYLGCYDYCLNDICEKEEKKKAVKQSVIQKVTSNIKKVTTTVKEKVNKTYYCKVVNGKYYDAKGKVVSKTAYTKSCVKEEKPVYKYQYKKTVNIEKQYSDWTNWSEDIEYDPNNNNINWGKHEFEWIEKNPDATETITNKYLVNDKTKPVYKKEHIYIGSYPKWTCGNYEFYIDYTTNTTYQVTSGWRYVGTITSTKILNDTNNIDYQIVSVDNNNCNNDTCSITTTYTYKKYVRSTTTTTNVSTSKSDLTAKCTNVVRKDIPVYNIEKNFVAYEKKIVEETQTKYYYHKKTRKLVQKADTKTYTQWSYSKNDKTLINQGYKYTGVYQKVK